MGLPSTTRKAELEKKYTRHYHLKYNINTDADIIEHLGKKSSIQGYIKKLIRDDMERNKEQ